jgi:transcriptional regulator with XRE-family HTH domain
MAPAAMSAADRARPDTTTFAGRVRLERLERELTQAEFADLTGINKETISNWERGTHGPSLLSVYRLARTTGRTVGYYLAGE